MRKKPGKINLANIPTPLEEIEFESKRFLIKRDDLTGVELSGNKVRKLEYLIYQAKKEKADMVFTCGGEQSNHVRATAIAAAKTGIKSKLFLWGSDSRTADGNLFFDKLIGAEISFLNKRNYSEVNEIMFEERDALIKKGKNVFVIPEGGSTTLGIWGYVDVIYELKKQIDLKKINGICLAAGTGGTAAGLLVGIAQLKLNLKVYAVNVLYPKEEIHDKIMNLAEGCVLDYKLKTKINEKNLIILDGYSREGYKNITDKKLKLIKRFAQSTGIILDPAYTGKAFSAFYEKFLFSKKKVIFLHTGGLFGVFGKRGKYLNI
jgi:D-cysteine desulfhydrase